MPVNRENEQQYLQNLQRQAMESGNTGLLSWANTQAANLGVTIPNPTGIAQGIAERQAYNVGVDPSNIDPRYTQSIATGTPYATAPAGITAGPRPAPATGQARTAMAPTGTAGQVQGLLDQLRQRIAQPGTYDPGSDPAYEVVRQQVEEDVLDRMARRGLLRSGITTNELAEAIARAIPALQQQYYARQQGETRNLFDFLNAYSGLEQQEYSRRTAEEQQAYGRRTAEEQEAYERQRYVEEVAREQRAAKKKEDIEEEKRKLERARFLIKESPVVTNELALITGLPVGTPTRWATEIVQKRATELAIREAEANADLQRTREDNAAVMARQESANAAALQRKKTPTAETETKQAQDLRSAAVKLSQSDDRWLGSSLAEKQEIIDEYLQLLGGGSSVSTADDVQSLIDEALANGATNEEIRQALLDDNINPASYGL